MRGKYLRRERVIKVYNSIDGIINYFKTVGTVGGGVFVLLSLGKTIEEVLIYGGAGGVSYVAGDSLNKLNNKMKEKILNNIEKKFSN